MARHASLPTPRERGFSIVETLIVVAIIAIMAAVALPNIGHYIKNFRIKGAAQLVASELSAARSKAIMSNTNDGVSFVVLDQNSFRFVQEDIKPDVDPTFKRLGGLRRLPTGVVFVATTAANSGRTLRFLRLGGFCNPAAGAPGCQDPVKSEDAYTPTELPALDATGSMNALYIAPDATGTMVIQVRETTTGLQRTVQIAPGGRVLPQP